MINCLREEEKMMKKGLVCGILVLFIGMSVIPSSGTISENSKSRTIINNGSLSGYVSDTSENPIEGARVRVYFHETYEEDYTDSSGYYKVDNIPICWCLKNCTASKQGYKIKWVLLAIDEKTTYDFVLTHNKSYISDLKNQQAIKNFYLQFLESFSLLERLLFPIFNRMLFS